MQMTLPGAPTVYYGDEAGVCGFTDPDNRRTYPWGHEDTELIDFHRAAIKMHKENDVLRKGSYKSLYSAYNVVAYGRFTSDDAAIIIVNNNDDEVRARIPAWEVGLGLMMMLSSCWLHLKVDTVQTGLVIIFRMAGLILD